MEKLNMAKVNMLLKKGYLLAGVMMAANIFAVNEMKAMEINKPNKEEEKLTSLPAAAPPIGFDSNSINKNNLGIDENYQNRPIKLQLNNQQESILKSIPPSFANLVYLGAINKNGKTKTRESRGGQNFSAVYYLWWRMLSFLGH